MTETPPAAGQGSGLADGERQAGPQLRQRQHPGASKDGGEDGLLIVPLLEALQKEVDRQKYIAQYNPAAQFTGELSVVGDRNMPYRMLTEILYTAGQAELDSYRFVVIKKEGGDEGAAPGGGEGWHETGGPRPLPDSSWHSAQRTAKGTATSRPRAMSKPQEMHTP